MPSEPARPAPKLTGITLTDGDYEVTITASTVTITGVGPRGGRNPIATYKPMELARLRRLLEMAAEQQEKFTP